MSLDGELPAPASIADAMGGQEILRAWIDKGRLAARSRPEAFDAAEWGFVLSDVFSHVVMALHEAGDLETEGAIEELLSAFVTSPAPLPKAAPRAALAVARPGGAEEDEEDSDDTDLVPLPKPTCSASAREFLRIWVIDEMLTVTLDDEPVRGASQWGHLLAGLAAHVARELESTGEGDAEELSDVVRASFLMALTADESDDSEE